jgi:hypothetical protein
LTETPGQTLYQPANDDPSDGRHHLGMMGAIISEWVGGIVGIRNHANNPDDDCGSCVPLR